MIRKETIMRCAVLAIALLSIVARGGIAQPAPRGQQGIIVSNAWARASAGPAKTGAAYATVTDNGPPDRLISVSTPIAGRADLHESRNENGVMQMRPVSSLPLATGKPLTLAPGGYHVMLMDMRKPLQAGDSFPLTLTFEHAPPVTVQVNVAPAGAAAPTMSHDMGGPSGSQHTGGSKP
jgi:copper(I)-binding protein